MGRRRCGMCDPPRSGGKIRRGNNRRAGNHAPCKTGEHGRTASDRFARSVNKPQDVEPGVPKDPTATDENSNESDETEDATMDAGDNPDTGEGPVEEDAAQEEEKPEIQLNKNEFATEFGMKYLSRLFVQLIDSIDSSYRKLSTIKNINKRLVVELVNLKEIVEEENENIIVTNIWETQTKYYLYVDKYKEILKRLGVGIVPDKK